MKKIVVAAEVFSSNLGDYAIYNSLSTLLSNRDIETIPLDISFRRRFSDERTISQAMKSNWRNIIPSKIKHHKITQHIIKTTMWYLVYEKDVITYWSELIRNSDGVIIGGGQLLTDTSADFHTKIALIVDIANKFHKPICILGCGVGNNLGRKASKNIKNILKSAVFISLRDAESAVRVKSHIKKNTILNVYPDLAFALRMSNKENLEKEASKFKKAVCGFNIMPFDAFKKYNPNLKNANFETYSNFWKLLAKEANKEEMQVHIMTNGSIRDYEQAEHIYKSMLSDNIDVTLLDRPIYPRELYEQICNVDCLITTRMHSGIIGQAYDKQVTTLIWDDKIPGVWEEAGNRQVAINSDIILNPEPWTVVKLAFESSKSISLTDLNTKISASLDECLKAIYS